MKITTSSLVLILTNCVPLFGVIFLGWDATAVVLTYWAETGIIFLSVFIQIAVIGYIDKSNLYRRRTPLLLILYIFIFGFLLSLSFSFIWFLIQAVPSIFTHNQVINVTIVDLLMSIPVIGVVSLLINHAVSLVLGFFIEKAYETTNMATVLLVSFKRVFVIVFMIAAGFFIIPISTLVTKSHGPTILLSLLIIIKIFFDLCLMSRTSPLQVFR